jgi:hypothetical protein
LLALFYPLNLKLTRANERLFTAFGLKFNHPIPVFLKSYAFTKINRIARNGTAYFAGGTHNTTTWTLIKGIFFTFLS